MKKIRRSLLLFSFLFLPITLNFFSPYLIIDGLANKVLSGAFIVWTVMFVSSLIFGRAFCSYICPYGGLQMIVDGVIHKPLKQIKYLKVARYILGLIWLSLIIIFIVLNINGAKVDFLYLTESFVSADNIYKLLFYYFLVLTLIIFPFVLGKRGLCVYFCPMSILNIIGCKIKNLLHLPSLKLEAQASNCKSCNKCNSVCPMSLNVSNLVKVNKANTVDCILCGECSRACKFNAIKRKFGR